MGEKTDEAKGKVKEVLGAVTGDRRVEAEGRAERKASSPAAAVDHVSADVVDREEHDIREERHDIGS